MKRLLLCLLLGVSMFTLGASGALACCNNEFPVLEGCDFEPEYLWPPNHKMVDVVVIPYGENIDSWYITDVITTEALGPCVDPDPFDDDDVCHVGNDPDFAIDPDDPQLLRLRKERTGEFGSRFYNLELWMTTDTGVGAYGYCAIAVPHDMGN